MSALRARLESVCAAHGIGLLWADDYVAVVDKPYAMPSQRTRDGEPGLIDHLWDGGLPGAALHHRLDRPASGCLAVALTSEANPGLAEAFRSRSAHRTYRVVLMGRLSQGITWAQPLDGQDARTDVQPEGSRSGFTAAEVRLHTGRTHQIRKHAAMAGLPVAGDRRYGGEAGHAWRRLALHAWTLELPHPVETNQVIRAEAPLPRSLMKLWTLAGGG